MSEHVVYVDRFQIRQGSLADFKRYATEMAELVEENEPGALSFNYYVDEDGASGTAVSFSPTRRRWTPTSILPPPGSRRDTSS